MEEQKIRNPEESPALEIETPQTNTNSVMPPLKNTEQPNVQRDKKSWWKSLKISDVTNFLLIIFTYLLWRSADSANNLNKKNSINQDSVFRQQQENFVKQNGAILEFSVDSIIFPTGKNLIILRYDVLNLNKNAAKITGMALRICNESKGCDIPDASYLKPNTVNRYVVEDRPIQMDLPQEFDAPQWYKDEITNDGRFIFMAGYVRYQDIITNTKRAYIFKLQVQINVRTQFISNVFLSNDNVNE